ncbi:MAG: hypothetical protein FWG30_05285 [Eubacteriaceae bacterium]|nr:hypothetical protein [Eubacteriaceae bacterium]
MSEEKKNSMNESGSQKSSHQQYSKSLRHIANEAISLAEDIFLLNAEIGIFALSKIKSVIDRRISGAEAVGKADHSHMGPDHDEHDQDGHDHDGHDHGEHDHDEHDHGGHDHDEHDHDGHDHDSEDEHDHAEEGQEYLGITTHDESVVGSVRRFYSGTYEDAVEYMQGKVKAVAEKVAAAGGIIGHIKAYIRSEGDSCMLSVTDDESDSNIRMYPSEKTTLEMASIVFLITPDELKGILESEF